MHRADDRADRELPFEAEPQVGQHRQDRHDDAERAALHQLARDARADRLDAAELVRVAEGLPQLADRRLLALLAARLDVEPDGHVALRARALRLDGAEAQSFGRGAQVGEIRDAALGAQLDLRAAGEVDAEVHADGEEHRHRDDRQERRQRVAHAAQPHEPELGVFRREAKQFHREDFRAQIGSLVARLRRYHSAIIMRVIVTAVMIEVRMPSPSDTAKPRTAPDPNR